MTEPATARRVPLGSLRTFANPKPQSLTPFGSHGQIRRRRKVTIDSLIRVGDRRKLAIAFVVPETAATSNSCGRGARMVRGFRSDECSFAAPWATNVIALAVHRCARVQSQSSAARRCIHSRSSGKA